MTRVSTVLVIAALVCSACSAGHQGGWDARSVEPTTTPGPSSGSTKADDGSASRRPPTTVPAPTAESPSRDGCPVTGADRLEAVVALAIEGLANTTAADGWSTACARVQVPTRPEAPNIVTVSIGWMGTLHEYESIPGRTPIANLADEAYAFDAGHRIALRSGELVAVVSFTGGSPSDTEAVARQVADHLTGGGSLLE